MVCSLSFMHGFRVILADGTEEIIEADEYSVDDGGDLEIRGGGMPVKTFDLASWVEVIEVGQQLSEDWPYPNMQNAIDGAIHQMAKQGNIPSGPLPDPNDWRMNDFDSLVAAIVGADGIDIDTSDRHEREIVYLVRAAIAKEFSLRWRKPKSK